MKYFNFAKKYPGVCRDRIYAYRRLLKSNIMLGPSIESVWKNKQSIKNYESK